jgi:hypothetical protein
VFTSRIEEAAPILNGDAATVKLKVVSSQTSIKRNGFVSVDELRPGNKKTLQGILPQVIRQFQNRGGQSCRGQSLG